MTIHLSRSSAGLLLAGGTAAILALLGSVALGLWVTRDAELAGVERTSAALAVALDQHVETVVTAVDAALKTALAEIDEARARGEGDRARINAILARSIAFHRHFFNAVITDENGKIAYDPRFEDPPAADLSDRDFFLAHRDHPGSGFSSGSRSSAASPAMR